MNKLILADNHAIFRSGAARILALVDDVRIVAQCDDSVRLLAAIDHFCGAIILCASTMQTDINLVISHAQAAGSRLIFMIENQEEVTESVASQLAGILRRNSSSAELIDCLRRVASGQCSMRSATVAAVIAVDTTRARVRAHLTPKEMQIVALIAAGCRNKVIASRLNSTEQVIKNYLRGIYTKTGVSDRLALALFVLHHRVLADSTGTPTVLIQETPPPDRSINAQ